MLSFCIEKLVKKSLHCFEVVRLNELSSPRGQTYIIRPRQNLKALNVFLLRHLCCDYQVVRNSCQVVDEKGWMRGGGVRL